MTTYAYLILALLLAGPLPEAPVAQAEVLSPPAPGLLISKHDALADVDQLCVLLVTSGAKQTESLVDYPALQARAVAALRAQRIEHVACKTGVTPRLQIHVETLRFGKTQLCVYRVQTALSRIVTFTDHRELRVQADVWRLNPVMAAAPEADLADALGAAVLTQVEAFAGAYHAAQRFYRHAGDAGTIPPEPPSASTPAVEGLTDQTTVQHPYVASKSSSVFHRADCRWARNIAAKNRVTYPTRAAAIQAGKRPCKTCKP
jgi:hypothetical protein